MGIFCIKRTINMSSKKSYIEFMLIICMLKYLGGGALMSTILFEMHERIRWSDGGIGG